MLRKLGVKGNFLSLVKTIYKNLQLLNSMLKDQKHFPLNQKQYKTPTFTTFTQIVFKVLARKIDKKKKLTEFRLEKK